MQSIAPRSSFELPIRELKPPSSCEQTTKFGAVLLLGLLAAATLLTFPPDHYAFYPRCPFFEATGLLCPGCGGTRAVAALLHGDLPGAWHQNALLVALSPCVVVYGSLRLAFGQVRVPAVLWVALASAIVIFTVERNI